MDVLNYYLNRSINGNVGQRLSFSFKVGEFYCSHQDYIFCETQEEPEPLISPILAMAHDGGTIVASANEAGYVELNNIYDVKSIAHLELHQNAIFDIKWRPEEPGQLLTASGDLSIALVDVESPNKKKVHFTNSHVCSVRSMDFLDTNTFASGARDGHIKIWDLRLASEPVIDIPFAHVVHSKLPKRHMRYKMCKSCPTNVVTAVLFDSYHLYSGGASDGIIKVWDIRKQGTSNIQPFHQIPYVNKNGFSNKQGFTCLAMSRGFLYASCSDNKVYCYSRQQDKMINCYKGAFINNYTRIAILQDEYLVSGSMEKGACVWKVNNQNESEQAILPQYILPEDSEISSVEVVDKTGLIFTGAEEGRIRRWTFEYAPPEVKILAATPYEETNQDSFILERDTENIAVNNVQETETQPVSDNSNNSRIRLSALPATNRSTNKRDKRKSRQDTSPRVKRTPKSKQKPMEPLTPITNYYQIIPLKSEPK